MPKKTKKEKALAQARRIIQSARLQSSIAPSQSVHVTQTETYTPSTFEFKAKPIASSISAKTEKSDEKEFSAIRKDIAKTVILAGAAIAFEFIVYLRLGK
jgi:hypothetical protein